MAIRNNVTKGVTAKLGFKATHAEIDAQCDQGANPDDPDTKSPGANLDARRVRAMNGAHQYRAASISWVPQAVRWSHLKAERSATHHRPLVDDAMAAIERDNPSLKGVLPKDYGRPGLDKQRLGQIINLVSDIALGRVYENFLARFASAEGKSGGQFYTLSHAVRVLVEMLTPCNGRVYDPCCGSGGMFVQSETFIEAHAGQLGDISFYGQESDSTTWRLAKMTISPGAKSDSVAGPVGAAATDGRRSLAIRGIDRHRPRQQAAGGYARCGSFWPQTRMRRWRRASITLSSSAFDSP